MTATVESVPEIVNVWVDGITTIGGKQIRVKVSWIEDEAQACITLAEAKSQPGEREPWRFAFVESEFRRIVALLPVPDHAALFEQLAATEHDRWGDWQRYMHEKCERNSDGSLTIPAWAVDRWERQIRTPYAALTEPEKESDREQVRRYWPLIEPLLVPASLPAGTGGREGGGG